MSCCCGIAPIAQNTGQSNSFHSLSNFKTVGYFPGSLGFSQTDLLSVSPAFQASELEPVATLRRQS